MLTTDEPRETNFAGYLILPKSFLDKQWSYQLLQREGNVCLYKKWKMGDYKDTADKQIAVNYEIFIIQEYPEREFNDVKTPAKEAIPTSELWGVQGWTESELDKAKERYLIVLNRPKSVKKAKI